MSIEEKLDHIKKLGSILGLERMNALLMRLGNPQESLRAIHVAGTNGKGSVCRYVYEILRVSGYRVGLFTSPVIANIAGIEVDGRVISENEFATLAAQVLDEVDRMVAMGMDSPTEFEVTTAIAFLYFQNQMLDFIVLEVGLGGKLDSTNVIDPIVTAITSISKDHTQILGETIEEIAGEKAGIIKKGIPLVIALSPTTDKEALSVILKQAHSMEVEVENTNEYDVKIVEKSMEGYTFSLKLRNNRTYENVQILMVGDHQIRNASVAIGCIEAINRLIDRGNEIKLEGYSKINKGSIMEGLKFAKMEGRFELIEKTPYIIFDGAHNVAGANALKETVFDLFGENEIMQGDFRIGLVLALMQDKEIREIINIFSEFSQILIATQAKVERSMSAEKLEEVIMLSGASKREVFSFPKSSEALAYGRELLKSQKIDVLIVAGSLYLINDLKSDMNSAEETSSMA